jgi:hypothetical protein
MPAEKGPSIAVHRSVPEKISVRPSLTATSDKMESLDGVTVWPSPTAITNETNDQSKALILYTPPWQPNTVKKVERDNRVFIIYDPLRDLLCRPFFYIERGPPESPRIPPGRPRPRYFNRPLPSVRSSNRQNPQFSVLQSIDYRRNLWHSSYLQDLSYVPRKYILDAPRSTSCHDKALKAFTIFPNLPIELRRKIWEMVAHFPRLLEVQTETWEGMEYHPYRHSYGNMSLASRKTPLMLHVSREAREEGLRFYQPLSFSFTGPRDPSLWTVDHTPAPPRDPEIKHILVGELYYNPKADIILFGHSTCQGTVASFVRSNTYIPRIAVLLSESDLANGYPGCSRTCKSHPCFPLGISFPSFEPGQTWLDQLIGIFRGFDVLLMDDREATDGQEDNWYPGVKGLRDIFFVVDPLPLLPLIPGPSTMWKVDGLVGIVPVDYKFVVECAPRELSSAADFRRVLLDLEADEALEENPWVGKGKPLITLGQYVMLPFNIRVLEHWVVRINSWLQYEPIPHDNRTSDCGYRVYPHRFYGPGDYILSFEGEREEVANCKTAVADHYFNKYGDLLGVDVPMVEISEAVMPKLDIEAFVNC